MPIQSFDQIITKGSTLGARAYHGSVVFQNKLYVMMGYNGATRLSDICFSQNARDWRVRSAITDTKGATIVARESFGLCEHNGKVYFMGGYDGTTSYNCMFVTNNMVHWRHLPNAPWSGRYGFVALSYDQRLWVLGGIAAGVRLNEVWWTRDGMTWRQEANAPWAARLYHAGIVHNGKMFIMGGQTGATTRANDVWYSPDGRHWTQMETSAKWSARDLHAVAKMGPGPSRIALLGGQVAAASYSDQLYHSGSGNNWNGGSIGVPMGNLRGHSMDYFNRRLIVFGGINTATYRNQVWESRGNLFEEI